MNRKILLMVAFFLLFAPLSHALRCGNKLVSEGDRVVRVLELCGEPSQIEKRTVYKTRGVALSRPLNTRYASAQYNVGAFEQLTEEITLEGWYYNFGPNRLSRQIWFQNGQVVEIETLSYGH